MGGRQVHDSHAPLRSGGGCFRGFGFGVLGFIGFEWVYIPRPPGGSKSRSLKGVPIKYPIIV